MTRVSQFIALYKHLSNSSSISALWSRHSSSLLYICLVTKIRERCSIEQMGKWSSRGCSLREECVSMWLPSRRRLCRLQMPALYTLPPHVKFLESVSFASLVHLTAPWSTTNGLESLNSTRWTETLGNFLRLQGYFFASLCLFNILSEQFSRPIQLRISLCHTFMCELRFDTLPRKCLPLCSWPSHLPSFSRFLF